MKLKTHLGHLVRRVLLGAGLSGSHHVWFEQSTFQEDVVVVESLVHKGQHSFCHLLCTVQVVLTVGKNLNGKD